MRITRLIVAALAVALPARGAAQDTAIVIHPESSSVRLDERDLPRIVADEAIRLYNAPTTTRLVGRSRLPAGNAWRGDVAVRNGPALIAGRIEGTLLVINGDAELENDQRPSALPAYVKKYERSVAEDLQQTFDDLDRQFHTRIRIRPTRVRLTEA